MSRIDHALDPTDASAAVSSLDFDTNWLLEISNETPEQVMPHIERIYSIMNRMQLVTSRFARVCNDSASLDDVDRAIAKVAEELSQ